MLPKRQLQLQLLGRLNLQRSGHMASTLRRIHSDPVVLTHSPKRDLVRSIVKYTNSARLGFYIQHCETKGCIREWARDGPETEALKEAKVELAELLAEDPGLR